jgi:hypothetical protein
LRRSSTGQSQIDSSRAAAAFDPATLPDFAAFSNVLQQLIGPLFAVERTFAEQENASHTVGDAVIPASFGGVGETCARAIVIGGSAKAVDRRNLP